VKRALLIAKHEFAVNSRRAGFLIVTLAFPLLGALGLLLALNFGERIAKGISELEVGELKQGIGYVDHTGLLSPRSGFIPYPDEATARAALLGGEIGTYLVIPADYLESGKGLCYTRSRSPISTSPDSAVSSRARDFLLDNLLEREGVDKKLKERLRSPASLIAMQVNERGEAQPLNIFGFMMPLIFAILLIMSIFTASGYLLQGVAEEKENRIMEILISSVTATELFTGKILGLGAVGLAQMAVWLTSSRLIAGIASLQLVAFQGAGIPAFTLASIILYFLMGYLLFASLMAGVGALGTTMREGQQIASVFSIVAAIPMMFMSLVMLNPDSALWLVLSYFPLTSPSMMLLRMAVATVPGWQMALSLTLLALSIPSSIWASAKVFRIGLLMYGKRPSLGEIVRAFRAG